jgi:hypothetical protein
MEYCRISVIFAYAMTIYTLSSIYYFLRSKNTPFMNSLTKEQLEIKKRSAKERKKIFFQGVGLSFILLVFWRPFSNC